MPKRRKPAIPAPSRSDVIARLNGHPEPHYVFKLYIAGTNLNSVRAIEQVRRLCIALRPSRCDLDVIDLFQQSELAKQDEIIAAPALIKVSPAPKQVFVGDLSNMPRIFAGLGIVTRSEDEGTNSTRH